VNVAQLNTRKREPKYVYRDSIHVLKQSSIDSAKVGYIHHVFINQIEKTRLVMIKLTLKLHRDKKETKCEENLQGISAKCRLRRLVALHQKVRREHVIFPVDIKETFDGAGLTEAKTSIMSVISGV